MIIPMAALLLILSVRLFGGRLSRLAGVRLRLLPLVLLALLAQVLVLQLDLPAGPGQAAVHVASYLAAGAFSWVNRRVPGILLIAGGAAANGVVIALNGGVLPASADALARAGIVQEPGTFVNSGVLEHPRLAFLGDIFAVPSAVPLANVFSIGDVLIVLGAGYASYRICGTFRWAPWDAHRHGHGYRVRGRHRATAPVPAPPAADGTETSTDPPAPAPTAPAPTTSGPTAPAPTTDLTPETPDPAPVPRRRSRRSGPSGRQRTRADRPDRGSTGPAPRPPLPDPAAERPPLVVPAPRVPWTGPASLSPDSAADSAAARPETGPDEGSGAANPGLDQLIAMFPQTRTDTGGTTNTGTTNTGAADTDTTGTGPTGTGTAAAPVMTAPAARTVMTVGRRPRIPWPRRRARTGTAIEAPRLEQTPEPVPSACTDPTRTPGPPAPQTPDTEAFARQGFPDVEGWPAEVVQTGTQIPETGQFLGQSTEYPSSPIGQFPTYTVESPYCGPTPPGSGDPGPTHPEPTDAGAVAGPPEPEAAGRPALPVQPVALTITPRKGRLGARFRAR